MSGQRAAGRDGSKPSVGERKRPALHKPPRVETIWLDITSGVGVDQNRRVVRPVLGGRRTRNAHLVDLLNTAREQRVERIVLCGALPDTVAAVRGFLNGAPGQDFGDYAPGWQLGASQHAKPPAFTGRYVHTESGHKVTVKTTEEWFRGEVLDPEQARWAESRAC